MLELSRFLPSTTITLQGFTLLLHILFYNRKLCTLYIPERLTPLLSTIYQVVLHSSELNICYPISAHLQQACNLTNIAEFYHNFKILASEQSYIFVCHVKVK
jgi:hypothetical protein